MANSQSYSGSMDPMTSLAGECRADKQYLHSTVSGYGRAQFGDSHLRYFGGSHVHHHGLEGAEITLKPRKPINTLKWRQDPQFIGREETLSNIRSRLQQYGCAALTGAGGIGKSQTAIEFCWRWLETAPHFHVFWIYASSVEAFDTDYRKLARKLRLGCSAPEIRATEMRDGVKDWLEENDDWVMVVDNADAYDDFFGSGHQAEDVMIKEALPLHRPGTAMMLYTSRHARIGAELTEFNHLPLGILSPDDSRLMFEQKLGSPVAERQASELVRAVEYLPMSIAHAAAYMKFTKVTVDEYISQLQDDHGLLDLLDQPLDTGRREARAPKSVVKAWLATFDLLLRNNRTAASLFCLMACLDRHSISTNFLSQAAKFPRDISREGTPDLSFARLSQASVNIALAELESLALITRALDGSSFTMHRFVQTITVQHLFSIGMLSEIVCTSANCLMELFLPEATHLPPQDLPLVKSQELEIAQQLIPSVEMVANSLERVRQPGPRAQLLLRMAIYHHHRGHDGRASNCATEGAKAARSAKDDDLTLRLNSMRLFCHKTGKLSDVKALEASILSEYGQHVQYLDHWNINVMQELMSTGKFSKVEHVCRALLDNNASTPLAIVFAQAYLAWVFTVMSNGEERNLKIATLLPDVETEVQRICATMHDSTAEDMLPLISLPNILSCIYRLHYRRLDEAEKMLEVCSELYLYCGELAGLLQIRIDRLSIRCDRLRGQFDNATREQIYELESEAQDISDHVAKDLPSMVETPAEASLVGLLSVIKTMRLKRDNLNQGTEAVTKTTAAAEFQDIKQLMRKALQGMDTHLGPFAPATRDLVFQFRWCLLQVGSLEEANAFIQMRLTFMTEWTAENELVASEIDVVGHIDRIAFSGFESNHSTLVKLLCTYLYWHKKTKSGIPEDELLQRVWHVLERIQMRQLVLAVAAKYVSATKVVVHHATCDQCDQWPILGIRHRCLQCPDYDVCEACVALKPDRGESVHVHQFVPMYHEAYPHRKSTAWISMPPAHKYALTEYSHFADSSGMFATSIYERWHKNLADEKGYESEPDEIRRTKTRHRRYYGRHQTDDLLADSMHKRSRSLGRIGSEPSHSQAWQDIIPSTITGAALWTGVMEQALSNARSLC